MKSVCTLLLGILAVLSYAGCGKKEISTLQRKQGIAIASEADFAITLRNWERAEGLLVQATELCPDTSAYWISLGSTRVRLGKKDAAKAAYKKALASLEDAGDKDKKNAEPALRQVYVLALLGRVEDARALQTKLQSRFPDNREVRIFVEKKYLDQLIADPLFKQISL